MANDEPTSSAETFGHSLERVLEGGLLRLLAGKPIQQAIGRLVYGITDVPAAYLEQWAQSVRSDTTARKQIATAVATAARAKVLGNSELIDRGLERWTNRLGRRQKAREGVALRTLSILGEDNLPLEAAAPSDDFMDMFEDIAEKVSSDTLADLMARILAGEIRKPRSISRRTLQIVAILDQEIVSILSEFAPYTLEPGWFHIPPSHTNDWREKFWQLSNASISNEVGIRTMRFDASGQSRLRMGDKVIVVTSHPQSYSWFIDGSNLTPTGVELMSVLPFATGCKVKEVARGFKEHQQVLKVEVGDLIIKEGVAEISNVSEISS